MYLRAFTWRGVFLPVWVFLGPCTLGEAFKHGDSEFGLVELDSLLGVMMRDDGALRFFLLCFAIGCG